MAYSPWGRGGGWLSLGKGGGTYGAEDGGIEGWRTKGRESMYTGKFLGPPVLTFDWEAMRKMWTISRSKNGCSRPFPDLFVAKSLK